MRGMRELAGLFVVAMGACAIGACAAEDTSTHEFGPYTLEPGVERAHDCVQITLGNSDYLNVNAVELTTGTGFHHSNWFYVPEHIFPGDDGTYSCNDRNFNEPAAAIFGGVLFAQSTQSPHETQQFPDGVVIRVPPHSKLVAQIHLLNAGETPITVRPKIRLGTIPESAVTTTLAGISFEDHALGLPPNMSSRFTVECDIKTQHQQIFGRAPDFKIYYALAHYHVLGTGLDFEAVRDDGTSAMIYTTREKVGDTLGGMISPAFDMTGFSKLRFSCDYFNPTTNTVKWGNGDQEMCVFLAFSDSQYNWGGGVLEDDPPGNPQQVGNEMHFSNPCQVFANDGSR
jgi:hypothetical protein